MIELNLLPDVKMEYMKAQRTQRLVVSLSVLISAASIVLMGVLYGVDSLQKKHLSDLATDIKGKSSQLKSKPQIDKILTVQNQLESLTSLHATKPEVSKLFSYLNQVTPVEVSINTMTFDLTQNTATITGTSDTLFSVNKYVDTLKFATYTTPDVKKATAAFSNIVLSSFGFNANSSDSKNAANYSITLSYTHDIFDITKEASLTVPTTTTTRTTENGSPGNDLFQGAPAATNSGGTSNGQ